MATRRIAHDDQDTDVIQYTGQWFVNFSTREHVGNHGQPYLHTLHGTKHEAKIIFEFDGTDIEVYGSTPVSNPKADSNPTLECFVDGVSTGLQTISNTGENNQKLCGKGGLNAGRHRLYANITVQSPVQSFWLDQILYTPSPNVSLEDKTSMVANTDPDIHLDDKWKSLTRFNTTSVTNATARVDFFGTSVSWFGFIPIGLPQQAASGTYSVDNGQPVLFDLAGLPTGAKKSAYNQSFFTTPVVEKGHHTLIVTFLGSKKTTPLTLDYLYITNGTSNGILSSDTVITSASGATDTNTAGSAGDRGRSGPSIGTIMGSIIGGLVLVIILAGAFLYRRHRRLSQNDMLQHYGGGRGVSIPVNYYDGFPASIGPTITPTPYGGVPMPANQLSARERKALRVETQPPSSLMAGLTAVDPRVRRETIVYGCISTVDFN